MNLLFPKRPLRYEIELTNSCHNRCDGCSNVFTHKNNDYMENWREIIDKISQSKNKSKYALSIRFTGGEPSLHPEFDKILRYTEKKGIEFGIFTTGRWEHLDIDYFFAILKECTCFNGFLVSLHGDTSNMHNLFTRNNKSFDETCAFIKKASHEGFGLVTNTVITRPTLDKIESIVALSAKLGAHAALFERFLGDNNALQPSNEETVKAIEQINELHLKGKLCLSSSCLPKCYTAKCNEFTKSGFEICNIAPNGDIRPSNLTSFTFGNINQQSIEKIWASESAYHYRTNVSDHCLQCIELSNCRGGIKIETKAQILTFDPMIAKPITEPQLVNVTFKKDEVPMPNFELLTDANGAYLACYSSTKYITADAVQIAQSINGKKTIGDIYNLHGDYALRFIGVLYLQQYVYFE